MELENAFVRVIKGTEGVRYDMGRVVDYVSFRSPLTSPKAHINDYKKYLAPQSVSTAMPSRSWSHPTWDWFITW